MGMPAKKQEADPTELVAFTFRIPRGLLAAVDDCVDTLNATDPWRPINRSDFIRDALAKAVQEVQSAPADGPPVKLAGPLMKGGK